MSRLSEKYGSKVSAKEAKAIQKAMDEQKENRNKFKEVPAGEYKVVVDKLELGETSWGDPQITLWFKITDGEFKNSRIFYNGSFDDHFEHGINSTAILLADLLDDEELTSAQIAVILGRIRLWWLTSLQMQRKLWKSLPIIWTTPSPRARRPTRRDSLTSTRAMRSLMSMMSDQ